LGEVLEVSGERVADVPLAVALAAAPAAQLGGDAAADLVDGVVG